MNTQGPQSEDGRSADPSVSVTGQVLGDWCMLDVFVWALLLYRCEEEELVPLAWLQPGISYLFAAAGLVAIAPLLVQCRPHGEGAADVPGDAPPLDRW